MKTAAKTKAKIKKKTEKNKVKGKVGKKPLVIGERTIRAETRLPEKAAQRMHRKAGDNVSEYIRKLIYADLGLAA